jgi:hypothetical protein
MNELSDDTVDVNKSSINKVHDISELILMGLEDEEIGN